MRVHAVHDDAGNIRSLAIPSDEVEGGSMSVEPERGQRASEFDVEFVADERRQEFMNDLLRNHRVDRSTGTPRLVRKSGSPGPS